ncbi:MAG: MFS transporter [Rhizobiales bacterium]|nr:MFS transporter [Hyphomicrobiales bacterium]MBI3674425.1 MFS transporter [Hyphomicrobiales bacterium]
MPESSLASARRAVATMFLMFGFVFGAWVPQVPLAKDRLGVGVGVFGLALLAIAGGAVFAMPLTGALINRFGSARMAVVSGSLLYVAFLGPVLAPGFATFILAAFVFGMMIGSLDVAVNAHGIAVEKRLGRPTMSMFHGLFSVGGLIGTFLSAALVETVGPLAQALAAAVLCLALHLGAARFLLPAMADKGLSQSHFAWPTSATVGLGLLCFLALLIEGSILDWGAIFMRERFLIATGYASLAFGSYQGGMALSRLAGDRLRLKFGSVRLVAVSAFVTAAGTAAGLLLPWPVPAIGAFIFAGLGLGNIAPVMFAGGGRLEPKAPGRGIAAVTTLGYMGFLSGPPLIGFTAELVTLPWALALTVAAALAIGLSARMVDAADAF